MSNNSCARPRANTGMRHLPPCVTMRSTVPVKRASRSARLACTCTPYVASVISTSGVPGGISAAIKCRSSSKL
eukprot:scaffold12350_cov171-Amphora_coffeaeformis.AAC.3